MKRKGSQKRRKTGKRKRRRKRRKRKRRKERKRKSTEERVVGKLFSKNVSHPRTLTECIFVEFVLLISGWWITNKILVIKPLPSS